MSEYIGPEVVVQRIKAGEIWSRYENEDRKGEFVMFDRIVVSGNLQVSRHYFWMNVSEISLVTISTSTNTCVDVRNDSEFRNQ